MPDEVVIGGADESPDSTEGQPEADDIGTATPSFDETTWKKRLAGKDQALTAKQKEAESLKAQVAEYQRRVAEFENANLSEVDKLQKELSDLRGQAAAAEAKALRLDLERKYPLAFDLMGDKTPLDDESWLAEREARLKKDAEDTGDLIVDANNPRRTPPRRQQEVSGDELVESLRKMGNPFKTSGWGGA